MRPTRADQSPLPQDWSPADARDVPHTWISRINGFNAVERIVVEAAGEGFRCIVLDSHQVPLTQQVTRRIASSGAEYVQGEEACQAVISWAHSQIRQPNQRTDFTPLLLVVLGQWALSRDLDALAVRGRQARIHLAVDEQVRNFASSVLRANVEGQYS